jgi:hypothetical protein
MKKRKHMRSLKYSSQDLFQRGIFNSLHYAHKKVFSESFKSSPKNFVDETVLFGLNKIGIRHIFTHLQSLFHLSMQ